MKNICQFLSWFKWFLLLLFGIKLSRNKAISLGLKWVRNIYGEEIKYTNCRSIWEDSKHREYFVEDFEEK